MPRSRRKIDEVRDALDRQLRASGDSWLPTHRRLYGVPAILPQEAASSWTWRIAAATRLPVRAILALWGVNMPSFWLDCGAASLDIDAIAKLTMTPAKVLQHVHGPQLSILADPEFACWTADPIRQRPIYRYCELCLKGDAVPYFRQYWRLASSYVCDRHGSILRDACWHCRLPIDLSRGIVSEGGARGLHPPSLRRCGRCGADLAAVDPQYLPSTILSCVFALQVELRYLIVRTVAPDLEHGQSQGREEFRLVHQAGPVIDMDNAKNVLALLGKVMLPALEKRVDANTPTVSADQVQRKLRRAIFYKSGGKRGTLAIGLNGVALFGKHAGLIGSYMMACQTVAGGTYWWGHKTLFEIDRLNAFKKQDILAGLRWIEVRGPSKSIAQP